MKKYIKSYFKFLNDTLSSEERLDYKKLKENHLNQIHFIQHERLIHLIVTFLFSIVLFICFIGMICFKQLIFLPLIFLLIILLIPYVIHYYFLENSVQKMYLMYNKLLEHEKESEEKLEVKF